MNDEGLLPVSVEDAGDAAAVAALLRLAGPRVPVPAERMARLRATAHGEWRTQVAARRRRRTLQWAVGGLAAAAALVLALRSTSGVRPALDPAALVATVEALNDSARVTLRSAVGVPSAVNAGDPVRAGRELRTAEHGALQLRLVGGGSVRLDGSTLVQLAAANTVVLEMGAVYVDSGGGAPLEVRTPLGVVHDIGTKFEVRLARGGLRVRVREGAVLVQRDQQRVDARASEEVTLDAGGSAARRAMAPDGPEWAWLAALRTRFEIEGRSLREFLEWIAEEGDWDLRFESAAVEERARTTTLHGSIEGLSPEQALDAVLPASGFEHELSRRVLSVRFGAEKP